MALPVLYSVPVTPYSPSSYDPQLPDQEWKHGPTMADREQPVTRPVAWRRKISGSSDSSLEHLNQEKQWENCQLAEKPESESWESCQDVEGAV